MKFTFFTLAIFVLFVGVSADSYQNGFITGMLVEKALPTKKATPTKYNTVIIDTSLFDFPAQKSPICRPIEVRERKYHELSFVERCVMAIIVTLIIMIPIHTCLCGTEDDRNFLLGHVVGVMVERLLNDDDK